MQSMGVEVVPIKEDIVMLDWAWWFLYHILVAYSVFFVLGIKSVRSLRCLLYSLYFLREDLVC